MKIKPRDWLEIPFTRRWVLLILESARQKVQRRG
jgi:hypothetical protein